MTSKGSSAFGGVFAGLLHNTRHLVGSVAAREARETKALHERVRAAYEASEFAGEDAAANFIFAVVNEAFARAGRAPSLPLGDVLFETVRELLDTEGAPFGFPEVDFSKHKSPADAMALRIYLRRVDRILTDPARLFSTWFENVAQILAGILEYLPDAAFDEAQDEGGMVPPLSVPFADLLARPAEIMERLIATMFAQDLVDSELFADTRSQLEQNLLRASGIDPSRAANSTRAITFPTESRITEPGALATRYLGNTPFALLFASLLPFSIPERARFEHCHILGGTGHGKTQLLQFLAHRDIMASLYDERSLIVIDSQGDLVDTLLRRSYFAPDADEGLADRLILIDPSDVEHPPALNLFDVNMERVAGFGAREREQVLNGTIELYEYLFGALLGAELTAKQGVIFSYLARLMLTIPGANLTTLLSLMDDHEPFRPYIEALGGTARRFFETEFFSSGFAGTRRQVARRLWSVLSLPTFERLFTQPRNRLDLFTAMNEGKIVFIKTAKDLLTQDGCAIFGRFFIAMIAQAALQRAAIPAAKRRPTFVYVDEAQEYFDERIGLLLAQARKFNVGMTLAHQNLDQLTPLLRAGVMANTSIKLAGGTSAKDAAAVAPELRCEPAFIQDMHKRDTRTEFACFVKGVTLRGLRLTAPLGTVAALPEMTDAELSTLIVGNHYLYGTAADEAPPAWESADQGRVAAPNAAPETVWAMLDKSATVSAKEESLVAPPPAAPSMKTEPQAQGRGGREHIYLQALITQVAQDHGYRATIERPVGDGSGSVDVVLERGELSIACEISVTTTPEQELQNVTKCLAAGFEKVFLIGPKARHLKRLEEHIAPHLSQDEVERVQFLLPDAAVAFFAEKTEGHGTDEAQKVRGYRVHVSQAPVDPKEAEMRRKAVAGVILRSMKRLTE